MPRQMKEVSTNFVKLGKGSEDSAEVEGVLIEKGSLSFKDNMVGRYKLESDDAEIGIQTVLGSVKIDDLLESVPVGTYIKLSYVGEISTKGGQTMNDIKLEVETA
ncbi:MAG: hypothetical protein FVQ79_07420 [Planctomycetes bacterium]|nr:hypothetical protein [Planctomycetota bacterium]